MRLTRRRLFGGASLTAVAILAPSAASAQVAQTTARVTRVDLEAGVISLRNRDPVQASAEYLEAIWPGQLVTVTYNPAGSPPFTVTAIEVVEGRPRPSRAENLPAGVDALLDPFVNTELIREFVYRRGQERYYVIKLTDIPPNEEYPDIAYGGGGELVVVRSPQTGVPVVVDDVRGLPDLLLGDETLAGLDIALREFGLEDTDLEVTPRDNFPLFPRGAEDPAPEIDGAIFEKATQQVDVLVSAHAPGTDNGNLACAWAVNQIARMALGDPIGGGLATAEMVKVLRAKHVKLTDNNPPAGAIIISPTAGGVTGHVGIIGAIPAVGQDRLVYSNSSSQAVWKQSHTLTTWRDYFEGVKGLEVEFYRLDGDYFPNSEQAAALRAR